MKKRKADKKEKNKLQKKRGRTQAQLADRHQLYQESVQDADGDVDRVRRMYQRHFGREPRHLREDFCGTALLACSWVRRRAEHLATGIDLDPEPLAWGREHNLSRLADSQRSRLQLIEGDVLEVHSEPADVIAAFNFSYSVFQTRAQLLHYFRQARAGLAPEGILVLDAYGGPEAQERRAETREYDGFDYVWDQDVFDPITHRTRCMIHFEFPDRSRLQRAFAYDWRLWMLPELRDVLEDAGFDEVEVYWEGTDGDNEPNGIFRPRKQAEDDPAWIAYVVAVHGRSRRTR